MNHTCSGIWLLKFLTLSAVLEFSLGELDLTVGKQVMGVTDITPGQTLQEMIK